MDAADDQSEPSPQADEEPQAFRPDHLDHDLAFARAKYAELAPKKDERVVMPKWMVLFLYLMVIVFVLMFAGRVFKMISS
ncbi:MAG: hypothetical protein ABI183_11430 [Polyangiaceae bacterium]